jgi:hypothetical protein
MVTDESFSDLADEFGEKSVHGADSRSAILKPPTAVFLKLF